MDLTITIPTYNEEVDLRACLSSLAKQDYDKKKFEVIIVDNESTDTTLSVARSFSKQLSIRCITNPIKDAEVSKMVGFRHAKGKYFMYMDADMVFREKKFIRSMLYPLQKNQRVSGVFCQFVVNPTHPPLTRTLSYDVFQRDPIFTFFTTSIEDIVTKKHKTYWECTCTKDLIPPQSLMVYRRQLILDYAKRNQQLIDNEIPAVLVHQGHTAFAFVPSVGVEHLLLRSLPELWRKRTRNLARTYYPNKDQRLFTWISWKRDWPKVGIWALYTGSILLPIITSLFRAGQYKDSCFLNEATLNLVSTASIAYGVLRGNRGGHAQIISPKERPSS